MQVSFLVQVQMLRPCRLASNLAASVRARMHPCQAPQVRLPRLLTISGRAAMLQHTLHVTLCCTWARAYLAIMALERTSRHRHPFCTSACQIWHLFCSVVSHHACASVGQELTTADALVLPPRSAAASSVQTPASQQPGPAAPVGSFHSQPGGPSRGASARMTTPGAPAVAITQQPPAAMMTPGAPAVATTQQPPVKPGIPAVATTQQSIAPVMTPGATAVATAQQSAMPAQQGTPPAPPKPSTAPQSCPSVPAQQVPLDGEGHRQGPAGRGAAHQQQAPRARPVFSQSVSVIRQPSVQVRAPSCLPLAPFGTGGFSLRVIGLLLIFRSSPAANLLCCSLLHGVMHHVLILSCLGPLKRHGSTRLLCCCLLA